MNVLFIIPPGNFSGFDYIPTFPHLATGYLASSVRTSHTVQILDMQLRRGYNDIKKMLRHFSPDIIGISTTSFQFNRVCSLVNKIKKLGDYTIILGGAHISTVKKEALELSAADLAVFGEGEHTLKEVCDDTPYSEIQGLIWRRGTNIIENAPRPYNQALDSLPFPSFDLFELDKYIEKKIPILTSRGCPYNCIFCAGWISMGKHFRARSAENVVAEIAHWAEKGFKLFQIQDDCFSYDIDRARKICNLIIENKLNIRFDCINGLRVDNVDESFLSLMKKAGCYLIAYGIESSDEGVLKAIDKGITLEKIRAAVKATQEAGILADGYFGVGFPNDTAEKALCTLRFAEELKLHQFTFYKPVPFPKTALYDWVDTHAKWTKAKKDYLTKTHRLQAKPMVYETDEFSEKERIRTFNYIKNYFMRRLFRNEFGVFFGLLGYTVWKIPFVFSKIAWTASYFFKRARRIKTEKLLLET